MKRKARGAYACIVRTTSYSSLRWQNFSADFTEANAVAIALTPARESNSVPVFEPFARLAVRQFQWIRTAPCQLEQAAARFFGLAADRSTREQIARLEIASANGVMRELLRNTPVKVLKIRSRNRVRRFHLRRLQFRLELDVEGEIILRAKIR